MTTRRTFLGLLTMSAVSAVYGGQANAAVETFKGKDIFDALLRKADAGKWRELPIGECMKRIAMELEGTPYVAFTLELDVDREFCSVNLAGLDCVTFFEQTLCLARMLKKGKTAPQDLLDEITFTRYRGGKLTDFTSRLHYTTDWMHDNETKGTVKILAPQLPGATKFTQKVGIMTARSKNYRQLAAHPELIPTITKLEAGINARDTWFIPMNFLNEAQNFLKSGDIVGITTTQEGIDISHTGLVIVDDKKVPRFMDASSSKQKMKVTLEPGPISEALNYSPKHTGAVFARPLDPKS